jgi:hypothetical protein
MSEQATAPGQLMEKDPHAVTTTSAAASPEERQMAGTSVTGNHTRNGQAKGEAKDFRRLFVLFGVEFGEPNGSGEAIADECPFCGKAKFYLNAAEGTYKCFSENACGEKGNAYTFIRWVYPTFVEYTTDDHRRRLKAKRGLPLQTITRHDLAWDEIHECWLIPYKSKEGEILNLQRYYPATGNKPFFPCLPVQLYGLDQLSRDKKDRILIVVEGPFDAMALDHHLRTRKIQDRYDILAVPSAGIFRREWLPYLEGYKAVRLCLDNDKAGREGQERIAKLVRENKTKCILYTLVWPDDRDQYPESCDIGDLVRRGDEVEQFTIDHCEVATDESNWNPPVPPFPTSVFPPLLERYIEAHSHSIHCRPDLLAVPLLAIAGAATGRSGRRLKVKPGWPTSSCLWTAALTPSSGGKTPALNAVMNFYDDRQEVEHYAYLDRKQAHDDDPDNNPKPGPYPALKLTDSTIESLQVDLASGPVLYARDELAGWCHQMGQYKTGKADRYDWCSFWSHSAVNIGRKTAGRVFVKEPFVGVTGMMVPSSAKELNYQGDADDGLVHRILLACPEDMAPLVTLEGVPEELTAAYRQRMSRLFDPPGEKDRILTFDPEALLLWQGWANDEHFALLKGQDAPGWLVSKYRKLSENCLRLCLVLHELWRVAGDWLPPKQEARSLETEGPARPNVIDRVTVGRAIAVVEYFRGHIETVQALLKKDEDANGSLVERVADSSAAIYARLCSKGKVTVRDVAHQSSLKKKEAILALFADWQSKGKGKVETGTRKDQLVFVFPEANAEEGAVEQSADTRA